MAQSDYLQRKKIGTILNPKNQGKLGKILDSDDYTQFKQYSLENTVINTSNVYNQIVHPKASIIFNMEVANPAYCPQYVMDHNTQTRANRQMTTDPVAFNPHVSMHRTYVNSYTNTYTPRQLTHQKHTPNRNLKCNACCTPKGAKATKAVNKPQENSYKTLCSNSRLKQLMCDCSMN
jgi:hypothetical protein